MSKWEKVKLGEVCKIINGKNQKKVESIEGKYPIYGSGGVIGYADEYLCEPNTVVLGRKGNINKPIYVKEAFWNVDTAFGLVADNAHLKPEYLYYFCENYDFEKLNTTVTIPSLTKANLLNVIMRLPNLKYQEKIVNLLNKIKNIIALQKEQLKKLDELVKSMFIEMFGDPIQNPFDWEKGIIRDVVEDVKYGTSQAANENGKYKYLRMGNITYDGYLDLSNLKYIDIIDNEVEKYIVRKGDVLFNRTNSKELVGKTCVFDIDEPMIIAGYIIRVRLGEKMLPTYFSIFLNSTYGKTTLYNMCKSIVGQANINAQELQNISILIPPLSLQNKFAGRVRGIDKSKFEIKQSLEKLEILYKSLMQEYFG